MSYNKKHTSEESQSEIEFKYFGKFPPAWDVSEIQPELHIYSKNHIFGKIQNSMIITHQITGEEMVSELIKAKMLPTKRFIFITHGYKSDVETNWLHQMKDEIIANNSDETVAIVGWGKGANPGYWIDKVGDFIQAAANSLAVGKWVAKYAISLNKYFDTDLADKMSALQLLHVTFSIFTILNPQSSFAAHCKNFTTKTPIWGIGHSLGAHLFGVAGRESRVFTRITGLDPAGPGFQTANHDKRLNKRDAQIVDVIHTDGKDFTYFGTIVPLGTIDFYPSYGWSQPTKSSHMKKQGSEVELVRVPTENEWYVRGFLTVSHSRAIDYFIWSIANKGKFKTNHKLDGTPDVEKEVHILTYCDDTAEMGYHADSVNGELLTPTGNYYIHPNPSIPWL